MQAKMAYRNMVRCWYEIRCMIHSGYALGDKSGAGAQSYRNASCKPSMVLSAGLAFVRNDVRVRPVQRRPDLLTLAHLVLEGPQVHRPDHVFPDGGLAVQQGQQLLQVGHHQAGLRMHTQTTKVSKETCQDVCQRAYQALHEKPVRIPLQQVPAGFLTL